MIRSCAECPQYVLAEIEPENPAFCLYHGLGLGPSIDGPICRWFKNGVIPKERITYLSEMAATTPYSQAGLEYCRSLEGGEASQNGGDASQAEPPVEGRHLVKIKQVRGYLHNFEGYRGPRARLWMEILEGPDAGKLLFDNISIPHPKESQGMIQRRARIAYRLGLIPWRGKGMLQVNWKLLEGVVCSVDVNYRTFRGRKIPTVDNYELLKDGDTGR